MKLKARPIKRVLVGGVVGFRAFKQPQFRTHDLAALTMRTPRANHMYSLHSYRVWGVLISLLLFLIALTACSDDKSETSKSTTTVDKPSQLGLPSTARPGELIEVSFSPSDTPRGLAFRLSRQTPSGKWDFVYTLLSGANGFTPSVAKAGSSVFVNDVAILAKTPDPVLMPSDLEPGRYQICTQDAPQHCGELTIEPPASPRSSN